MDIRTYNLLLMRIRRLKPPVSYRHVSNRLINIGIEWFASTPFNSPDDWWKLDLWG